MGPLRTAHLVGGFSEAVEVAGVSEMCVGSVPEGCWWAEQPAGGSPVLFEPGHPALTRILRQHIEDEELKPGDLLFQGENGGILAGSVIRRAWRSARMAVLAPHIFDSPTGKRVYDNRHTRLTKWLNDGVPPAQVAEWAGNSVPVLLATYARCVDGQLPDLKRRLEAAGDLPDVSGAG